MKKSFSALIQYYEKAIPNQLIALLADNCVYRSQWVFDEMIGKEKISAYLLKKADTIKKYRVFSTTEVIKILSPCPQLALLVNQGDNSIVVLVKEQNDIIESLDICMPELFQYCAIPEDEL